MELVWIVQAEYVKEYKVNVVFNDETNSVVDFESSLKGPVFEPLKNLEFFKQFTLNQWTIEWPNGADFAPEYIYQLATAAFMDKI